MKMMKKAARGFTLIELMIVVAIIGILAAIAIPNFLKYQLRTRRTEGSVNVAAIRTAEIAYFGSQDSFVTAAANPPAVTAGKKAKWDRTIDAWKQLGFEPEGDVYFQYETKHEGAAFNATAIADLDQNTAFSCWAFAKPTVDATTGAESLPGEAAKLPADCKPGKVPNAAGDALEDMKIADNYSKVVLFSGEDAF